MEFEEIKRAAERVHTMFWYLLIAQSSFGPKDTKRVCL